MHDATAMCMQVTWEVIPQLQNESSPEYAPPRYASLQKQLGAAVLERINSSDALTSAMYASDAKLNLTHLISVRYANDMCPGDGGACYTSL